MKSIKNTNNKTSIFFVGLILVSILLSLILNCYVTGVTNQVIHPIWLITHSSKKWILAWFAVFFFAGLSIKFTNIPFFLHKYRYAIGCAILLLCVCLNINGSSIGEWGKLINDGEQENSGNLIGTSRWVRGDEWNVFTPLALSQEYNDYGYISDIPRAADTDMFMVYGQPVKDISIIFRPFQIGYLFLGSSYGLSFYWMSRLIFLFLFSYEFILLITKRHKLLSIVGASMITFSPAIQWWFSINGYIEMIIAIEVSIVLFNKYMQINKLWYRMLCTSGIMICAGMYILTLYPPVMIPMAYVLLGLVAWVFTKNFKNCNITARDLLCTIAVACIFIVLLARIFYISNSTIMTIINTSYPGSREYTGGGVSLTSYFDSIYNILLPFKENFAIDNQSADARFIDFCPLNYILVILILLHKNKKEKLNLLIKIMLPINICLIAVTVLPMPNIFMKLTFLSKATNFRIVFAVQFSNIIILFSALTQLFFLKSKYIKPIAIILAVIIAIFILILEFNSRCSEIVASDKNINVENFKTWSLICTIILGIIIVVGLAMIKLPQLQNKWCALVLVTMVIAGGLVNPFRSGIDVVRNQNLSKKIQQISANDLDAKWIFNGTLGSNFLIANGAKTINSINVYPYLERWQKIDRDNSEFSTYNRYSHIFIEYTSNTSYSNNKFELLHGDTFKFTCSKEDLSSFGITYILSPKQNIQWLLQDNDFSVMYEDNQFLIFKYCKK